MQLPTARVDLVRDTYFGTTVEDPYRWMEDWQSDEAQRWLRAQADYAKEVLQSLPERSALLARISELSAGTTALTNLRVAGGRIFYLRRDPGEDLPRLVDREHADAPERVVVDPATEVGHVHSAIDWYEPSLDGRRVAYGISPGGSEDSTLRVVEVESGHTLDLAIEHVIYGGVQWLSDADAFVYNRSPDPADAGAGGRYTNSLMYLHRMGEDPARDRAVFGIGVNSAAPFEPVDIPFLLVEPDSHSLVGIVQHGDMQELTVYVAPRDLLWADPEYMPWQRLVDVPDAVVGVALAGERLYLRTHRDAPHFRIDVVELDGPGYPRYVLVPESELVLEDVRVAGDWLLLHAMDAGISRMQRVARTGGPVRDVTLPVEGSLLTWGGEHTSVQVWLELTSWTISPRVYGLDVAVGELTEMDWIPPSPADFSQIEAHQLRAPAADGTLIPLSVIHRKGTALDGSHPTLLMGYGSYGIVLSPHFIPAYLAWYERGGILAVAHMRGGGELGDDWHRGGFMLNKEHTITDFIACAEHLIFQGYTRRELLAGEGGSAGGIPSGGALVRRPELWAVMVMNVPLTDALRMETTENGPPNTLEFGSTATEEGFRALQIIDSYRRVRDGVPYPAVLVTTGANDPRVVPWMAMKMAARLQAASSSGRPVLLRVEYEGGHGMGSTRSQVDAELADTLAFLLWRLDVRGGAGES
jgi:prolyl oligopeptidase